MTEKDFAIWLSDYTDASRVLFSCENMYDHETYYLTHFGQQVFNKLTNKSV